jgi:hypothetical protein
MARKTAAELVKLAIPKVQTKQKWTELLSDDDTAYVCNIVTVMKRTPGAAPYVVARALKEELNLNVRHETIARTLKDLIAR